MTCFTGEWVQNCWETKEGHEDHNVNEVDVDNEEDIVSDCFVDAGGVAAVDPGATVVPGESHKKCEEQLSAVHIYEVWERFLIQFVDGETSNGW